MGAESILTGIFGAVASCAVVHFGAELFFPGYHVLFEQVTEAILPNGLWGLFGVDGTQFAHAGHNHVDFGGAFQAKEKLIDESLDAMLGPKV